MSDTLNRYDVVNFLRFLAREMGTECDGTKNQEFISLNWIADRLQEGANIDDPKFITSPPFVECAICGSKLGEGLKPLNHHWPHRPIINRPR